jgi:AcrR family transcriptional regulator
MKKQTESIKDKIIDNAVKLLRQSGLKSLGQIQVAKSANVSQGHLTYHFPKRSDLVLAVAERAVQPIWDILSSSPKSKTLTNAGLMKILKDILRDSQRTRALLGLLVESDENPELLNNLKKSFERERALVAAMLAKEARDPAVMITQATLMGLAIQHYLYRESADAPQMENVLMLLAKWTENSTKKRGTI